MNSKKMKAVVTLLTLFAVTMTFAQTTMSGLLVDDILGYKAAGDAKLDSLEDGTVKVARSYSRGTSTLDIRITKLTNNLKEELPKQVQRLTDEFVAMAADGRMEAEAKDSPELKGVLTFFEGTAGAILIIKGAYLLEYQLSEAKGVDLSRNVLAALSLASL